MRALSQFLAVCLCLCVMAAAPAGLRAEKISDIHPHNYVTDLSQAIDGPTAERINDLCAEVEQKTGAQIAVVTVQSLDGRPIEDYAVDLFKHLGVGRKDNRGVLLLVAPRERKYRFEVGYGLEPVINDARAGDIGRTMVPFLRQNNYSAAAELAVQRVAGLIASDRGVSLEQRPAPARVPQPEPNSGLPAWAILILIFGVFSVIRVLSRLGGQRRSSGWWWMGPIGGGWGSGGGSGGFGGSSGGFGGFGTGASGGGGASGSW
ncbi:MAG: TPM domain-containing protein [Terriglobales bacterium]